LNADDLRNARQGKSTTPKSAAPESASKREERLNAKEVREARQAKAGASGGRGDAGNPPPGSVANQRPLPKPSPAGRRWGGKRLVFIGIPLVLLVAAGAVVLPVLWRAHQAANKIFVTPPPQYQIVQNEQGTPEIRIRPTEQSQQGQQGQQQQGQSVVDSIPTWSGKDRINVLLLGVDDRGDTTAPPRSDTMILVSIDTSKKTVAMVSIPRDLLVTIPGHGEDKINAAYPYGSEEQITGPGLAEATFEYNFKINVDYYAEVDFTGFQKIVNTLGGVTLDVATPIKDDEYPGALSNYTRVVFQTGLQHMDGEEALKYARTRHDDNDFARGNRQQQVLQALRQQGTQLGLITKAPTLLSELGDTVRTDLSLTQTLSLAKLGTQIDSANIQSYSLLPALSESSTAAGYYLIPDWDAIGQIMDQATGGNAPSGSSDSGTTPTPSPSAPDYGASVLVQNATQVNRLASNSSDVLIAEGFTSVTPAQAPDSTGRHNTTVVDYSGNIATAQRIAEILNLPDSVVSEGDPQDAGDYDVVVTLGADAPIPTPSP
jgi:LCP family protein required for cell wall assembly